MDFLRRTDTFSKHVSKFLRQAPINLSLEFALPHTISNIAVEATSDESLSIFSVDTNSVIHYSVSHKGRAAQLNDGDEESNGGPSSSVSLMRHERGNADDSFPAISDSPMNLFSRPLSCSLVAVGKGDILIVDKETLKVSTNLFTLWDTSLVFRSNSAADYLCHDREDMIAVSSSGSAGCIFDLRCPNFPVHFFGDDDSTPALNGPRRSHGFTRHHSVVGITTCCGLGENAVLGGLADGNVALYDLRVNCSSIRQKRSRGGADPNAPCKVQLATFIAKISRDNENPGRVAVLSSIGHLHVCHASELFLQSRSTISAVGVQPLPEVAPLHCPKRTAAFVPGTDGTVACTWPSSHGGDLACLSSPYTGHNVQFGEVRTRNVVPYFHMAVGLQIVVIASGSGKVAVFRP